MVKFLIPRQNKMRKKNQKIYGKQYLHELWKLWQSWAVPLQRTSKLAIPRLPSSPWVWWLWAGTKRIDRQSSPWLTLKKHQLLTSTHVRDHPKHTLTLLHTFKNCLWNITKLHTTYTKTASRQPPDSLYSIINITKSKLGMQTKTLPRLTSPAYLNSPGKEKLVLRCMDYHTLSMKINLVREQNQRGMTEMMVMIGSGSVPRPGAGRKWGA